MTELERASAIERRLRRLEYILSSFDLDEGEAVELMTESFRMNVATWIGEVEVGIREIIEDHRRIILYIPLHRSSTLNGVYRYDRYIKDHGAN